VKWRDIGDEKCKKHGALMQKENPEQISTQFATVESIDEYRQGSATWCKSNKKNKKYQKDIRRTKNNFREW
jgi:hypothetical protein